jgi:hypothetical protein
VYPTLPFPLRFTNLAAARSRFGDRVDRLGVQLSRVDPPADALVKELERLGGNGWRAFAHAAAHGVSPDAPPAMRSFFEQAEHVPAWVDWEEIDRGGGVLLRAGPLGGLVLGLKSLVSGYASAGGNKPLMFSGRLREQAAQRLNETARFVRATCLPGALRRGGEGYRMTLKVRLIHAQIRRTILRSGRWKPELWGAPINQHDMLGTSLLFSLLVLQGLRKLGLRISEGEAAAYMQLWRYSGWLIGIDPELLPVTEREAARLADLLDATQGPPDDDSRALTKALLEAGMPSDPRRAARHVAVSAAICRELVGNDLANALGVPSTPLRPALPIVRRLVSGLDFVREKVPGGEGRAMALGISYWDRIVSSNSSSRTPQSPLHLSSGD